ncbi:MAG: prepilin-type N-terminal cleavage/methylation domain-containing protein [Actinobacteria bacterium]|nr:prepilin-type N-terminal cleavage/methylation domain-containing protein [Actinomycetota bacterium]
MKREDGFSLIELLAVIALTSILLTLGVTAIRYFWLGRALHGERDQVFTNLRALQQQVVSESNPLVFGAWFKVMTPATDDGTPQWGTVRYRPPPEGSAPGTPGTCTSTAQYRLDGTVQVESVNFVDTLVGATDTDDVTSVINQCRIQVPASAGANDFVFFLARGTATTGCVTLTQPARDMADVTVAVSTMTGRVERIDQSEVAARCP